MNIEFAHEQVRLYNEFLVGETNELAIRLYNQSLNFWLDILNREGVCHE